MKKRSYLSMIATLVIIMIMSVQGFSQNETIVMQNRYEKRTYDMENGGFLFVENITGDIKVSSWDKKEIEINIHKRGTRDDIEVFLDKRNNSFYIEVDYPEKRWYERDRSGSVNFDIKIPKRTELDMKNVTGDIIIWDIEGRIEATTTTGTVEIREVKGKVYGKTTTGSVRIFDVTGDVDAHSTTGQVEIRNTGDVDAHSTTGRIEIYNRNGSDIDASITTGDIDVELLKVDVRGRYEIKSTTGDIRIAIPGDAKADITARVRPKNLRSDFELIDEYEKRRDRRYRYDYSYKYDYSPRTFEARINGGGARIYLSSSHGDIDIIKR